MREFTRNKKAKKIARERFLAAVLADIIAVILFVIGFFLLLIHNSKWEVIMAIILWSYAFIVTINANDCYEKAKSIFYLKKAGEK